MISYGYSQVLLNTKFVRPFYNSKIKILKWFGIVLRKISLSMYKCDIDPNASIHKSVRFTHYIGIVIGPCKIGRDCTIIQNVTIGRQRDDKDYYPEIGDNVTIGASSVLLGNIKIGDNVTVGAGSIVVKDVPANVIIVGNPAKIIKTISNEK